eukprot:COSAG01_NODE_60038_length_296_cov_7.802030_1_plen_47_part_10
MFPISRNADDCSTLVAGGVVSRSSGRHGDARLKGVERGGGSQGPWQP